MPLYLLDTDIVTLHQRNDARVSAEIIARPASEVGVTIVTVEEQLRGRLSQIRRAKTSEERVHAYARLRLTMAYFFSMPVFDFDPRADELFQELRREHPRVGAQDLKIAAIALVHDATAITRNRSDFEQIPGLSVEDWSLLVE